MPRNTMKKKFSLKDHLFNREKVEYLAELFYVTNKSFKKKEFVEEVMTKFLKLELKERIVWIAEVLERHLPSDFAKACHLIRKALPPELDAKNQDDDFGDFIFAPLGEYVVQSGLKKEHLHDSFFTLHELTRRFSMEDAMRAFINTFPKETLKQYKLWVKDKNYHVRRLVSESTRPLLPWSRRIGLTSKETQPLLSKLHADNTRYVTRSVANHLNDIAKKEPKVVIDTLTTWKKLKKQNEAELAWMTKHALRTLVKEGNNDALELLGYGHAPKVVVERFDIESTSQKIAKNGMLSFSFVLQGEVDEQLLIDYGIDFIKSNGGTKTKVFKLKKVQIRKGECIQVSKKHRFRADATTYKLYAGKHKLALQINGKKSGSCTFEIV